MAADFKTNFLQYFTKDNSKALSYSIASVNNIAKEGSFDLQPKKFQFATCTKSLSIFISVNGGLNTGEVDSLQSKWAAQWANNSMAPIPTGFTSSLIFSSALVHKVLFAPGFKKTNWDIIQEDPYGSPASYAYWKILHTLNWSDKCITTDTGELKLQYRLCDTSNFDNPRRIDCKVTLEDNEFSLALDVTQMKFRMDQPEGNAIDFDTWRKSMEGLWTVAPTINIQAAGIGYLRTTNLLTPGGETIQVNTAIGLKAPKDFVLVGDVVE
ncbi:hypothetical protein TWF694_009380 [Orbilia ellipsospora]|uniref:Beta-lactamase n=1 Tax=Orbilia ellipsospora TaxID=2528407 RepID=A0AAV9XBH4_9PEZI